MNIVITVARSDTHGLVSGLAKACQRRNIDYSLFFTAAGVTALDDRDIIDCAVQASEAVACEFSWDQLRKDKDCPVEIGSQTDHSRLLKFADRMVTL